MIIESHHERAVQTLNLGCFPKDVLDYQESQEFFHHLVFIDYQLQLLVQNEFNGQELTPANHFEANGKTNPKQKLAQLIDYAHSITANYNDHSKSYEESFYYGVLLGHLHYLDSNEDDMHRALTSFKISTKDLANKHIHEFLEYLTVRYNVLIGLTNVDNSQQLWIEYLHYYTKRFNKSSIAANHWIDLIAERVIRLLTKNGRQPFSFADLKLQKFGTNTSSIITFGLFLLRTENKKYLADTFRGDFAEYLKEEVEARIAAKSSFPNATETAHSDNHFINTLYESLSQVPHKSRVFPPTLSKKFLITMTARTYQSQVVLSNYIQTLIELNEYDEALAAFKTYISYVEKDQQQHAGHIDNLLSIIDTYTHCILSFNPIESFVPRVKSPTKFKSTSSAVVLEALAQFVPQLRKYLAELTKVADLNYDEELDFAENRLSFLYHKYNVNVLLPDELHFIDLVSRAWYALGRYHYYLSTYESANLDILVSNTNKVIKYYKNSLIVNSTGNSRLLFDYALALAHNRDLQPALKLCKFILKKYPELFKTWNLLVLLLTSFETFDPDYVKKGSDSSLKELEKFVNNALNIAGLFLVKHRKNSIQLTVETKYEILQLKLTQLAVWEQIHGVAYIVDYIPEVFVLYHELFDEVVIEKDDAEVHLVLNDHEVDGRWSHRPSVLDPEPSDSPDVKLAKDRQAARDKIKRMSKITPVQAKIKPKPRPEDIKDPLQLRLFILEKKILQDVWLWTSRIYLKIGLLEEAEQCIVEAETIHEPNVKTYTHLGLLTSGSRKFLSLQEFERSLELFTEQEYNKKDYGSALLGLCRLFIIDDKINNSLFISSKDLNAGLIRLKTLLEQFSRSWPYGYNSAELWYFLSIIYERIDDKVHLMKSLWRSVELEDFRPVRGFEVCDEFSFY